MIYLALLALTVATWELVHLAAAGQRAFLARRGGRPAVLRVVASVSVIRSSRKVS
jgi:hypothetical protein